MPELNEAERAAMHRREVLTLWGFAAFLAIGLIALAVDAVRNVG